MKMMWTWKEENLLFFCICQTTYWASFTCTLLCSSSNRELFHVLVFNTILIFNRLIFLFIKNCLKSFKIHSKYRRFSFCNIIFSVNNCSVFILVVKPVKIVLAVFGTMQWRIFFTNIFLRYIRFLILIFKFLFSIWVIHRIIVLKIANLLLKLCWRFSTLRHTHNLFISTIHRIPSSIWIFSFRIFILFLNFFELIVLLSIFQFVQ